MFSHTLLEAISPARLGTYLNATGHDQARALQLYLWNARIAEAFHLPIQAVEVSLRNRISIGLATAFGDHWWRDAAFLSIADDWRKEDIDVARKRLKSKNKPIETGRLIAELSFGFWVGMIEGRYNPGIWGAHFRTAFPHAPDHVSRGRMHVEVRAIRNLRNRISHHEPIFRLDLLNEYHRCMEVIGWIAPAKAEWIKPYCRVSQIVRKKP